MEQLDDLIEILVQIVLVEYKYGLGAWSEARRGWPESDMEVMRVKGVRVKRHSESRA
jgi:hypothetical protein